MVGKISIVGEVKAEIFAFFEQQNMQTERDLKSKWTKCVDLGGVYTEKLYSK